MSRVVSCRQVLGVTVCCPAETESALMRVLPQREFERVGGNQTIPGLTLSFSNS